MTDRWPGPSELRVGLGCMRLSTDADRDERRALETIAAAVDAGISVFDTARSYGDNERLLVRALRATDAERARIVTKGGMRRAGGRWIPDGRAKTIRADCEASLEALDGLEVDLYLLHAPDPATPWRTSLRALARLQDERLVRRIGVANVNRHRLDEALELAPISAVQVALSPFDDAALRGGVLERCVEAGLALLAHSPLGGPRRAGRLARRQALTEVAEAHDAAPAECALAWLLGLSPLVVAVPGARRPETARSAARAARLRLAKKEHARLTDALVGARPTTRRRGGGAKVVLVMGVPGAGKARVAEEHAAGGYVRLNRDERGGSLRRLARGLDEVLAARARQVVLDNTYLTRASRSHVLDVAGRHGASVRCVWLDTPLPQAQVNLVERLLERFGHLPSPDELRAAAREPGVMGPTSQMRAFRELEPPSAEEGFSTIERVEFERATGSGRAGVIVAASALRRGNLAMPETGAPHLVFDWSADGAAPDLGDLAARLAATVGGSIEIALCPHGGGPPTCWCRPPLPGLPLAFARVHCVALARSTLVGTSPAHRNLAAALGAAYVAA